MYRYAFSFALKLTTTLLQKLATLHMRNVKKMTIEWIETHFTVVMVSKFE